MAWCAVWDARCGPWDAGCGVWGVGGVVGVVSGGWYVWFVVDLGRGVWDVVQDVGVVRCLMLDEHCYVRCAPTWGSTSQGRRHRHRQTKG